MSDEKKQDGAEVIDVSAIMTKSRVLREAARERQVVDARRRADAVAAGECPCQSAAEDPGPHLPGCKWSDPAYEPEDGSFPGHETPRGFDG